MMMALVRTLFVERNLHFILRIVEFIIRIRGKRNFKPIRDPRITTIIRSCFALKGCGWCLSVLRNFLILA